MPKKIATKKTANEPKQDIMASLLLKSSISNIQTGKEMDAKILSLSKRNILFDVGAKAKAVLGEKELKEIATYLPYLGEGDTVRVRIISAESREGFPVVSMRSFFEKGKWSILAEKKKDEKIIEVICGEYGKGGVFIDFMGIRGVVPKIQLAAEFLDDPAKLQGQRIEVKVLEVDEVKNRLVVSQKAATLNLSQKDLRNKFDKIKLNEEYSAKVLGVSEFGIFCEVEGVEGLVHISEISWGKIENINSVIKEGDKVSVRVMGKRDGKLSFSIKQAGEDPWTTAAKRFKKDEKYKGKIVRVSDYGIFVELEVGVEGLVHMTKIPPGMNFKVGDEINVTVEEIDTESKKIALGLVLTAVPVGYK